MEVAGTLLGPVQQRCAADREGGPLSEERMVVGEAGVGGEWGWYRFPCMLQVLRQPL